MRTDRFARCFLLAAAGVCLLRGAAWAQDDYTVLRKVMIPMRDGVQLAADVYLPRGDGPFPIVVARSVYGRGNAGFARPFLDLGAGFVVQDTRGRGDSEGEDRVFADDGWGERRDGADTIDWIHRQAWCNGRVGTWGASALGITQELMARATDRVACQVILVAPSAFYGQLSYQGGVWRKSLCEPWLTMQGNASVIGQWKAHPTDGLFWDKFNNATRTAEVTAPGLHVGGWWDLWPQGTVANFVERHARGGPGARGNQRLVMGPWGHGLTATPRNFGDLKLPANYRFDLVKLQERFYRHWLLGGAAGLDEEPAVRYYTLGDVDDPASPGNEWRTADAWPPFPTESTEYFLGARGTLEPEAGANGQQTFVFDPAKPCPTHGGGNLLLPSGPFDQRKVSDRDDVLRFSTAPLQSPLEATGSFSATLYVSTDAPDTDFTVKLLDIYPDGREILLQDGVRRLKLAEGFAAPAPATPGDVTRLTVELGVGSFVFHTGHRIGLHVSSSNYPRFEVNPNNGDDFPSGDAMRKAVNTVQFGPAHPSAVSLPVRK